MDGSKTPGKWQIDPNFNFFIKNFFSLNKKKIMKIFFYNLFWTKLFIFVEILGKQISYFEEKICC